MVPLNNTGFVSYALNFCPSLSFEVDLLPEIYLINQISQLCLTNYMKFCNNIFRNGSALYKVKAFKVILPQTYILKFFSVFFTVK